MKKIFWLRIDQAYISKWVFLLLTLVVYNKGIFAQNYPSMIPFHKDNKWGYCDSSKRIIIPAIYDNTMPSENGYGIVSNYVDSSDHRNFNCGMVDSTGKIIIPLIYRRVDYFHDGLAAVLKATERTKKEKPNEKKTASSEPKDLTPELIAKIAKEIIEKNGYRYGYVNKEGKEVIPAMYNDAHPFINGKAHVMLDIHHYVIDKQNKTIEDEGDDAGWAADLGRDKGIPAGLYESGNKYGLLDKSGKKKISEPIYDEAYNLKSGYAVVRTGKKYGLVDSNGRVVIPVEYDLIDKLNGKFQAKSDNYKYITWYDENGKIIIPKDHHYRYIGKFEYGYAPAEVYQDPVPGNSYPTDFYHYCLIDSTGKQVLPSIFFNYDKVGMIKKGLAFGVVAKPEGGGKMNWYSISSGKLFLENAPGDYFQFGCGLSVASSYNLKIREQRYGYIDTSGKITIPCVYLRAHVFKNNVAFVTDSLKKDLLIDRNGNIITVLDSFDIADISCPGAIIIRSRKNKRLYGLMDYNGRLLVSMKYKKLNPTNFENLFEVKYGNQTGYISKTGLEYFD